MTNGKMNAAVLNGVRSVATVQQRDIPNIGPDDALIRVVASGICRSDWHLWNGDWGWIDQKLFDVLGHEIGGVVEAVGENVRRIKVGQKVTIPFNLACGHCPYCKKGRHNICDNQKVPHSLDGSGGWAEYMRAPDADLNCIPLPDGVDELAAAALGCRYMTAWRAVRDRAQIQGGETLAVFGCGGVGQAAVEIGATLGARVIAVDVDDKKLEKMKKLGADATVNAKGMAPEEAAAAVKALTDGGIGADAAVDALGIRTTMLGALNSLCKGGRLAQVGLTSQDEKGQVALPTDLIVAFEWEIRGSLGNPQSGYHDLLSMVARGKLNPTRLVSEEVGLSDVARVLDDMDNFRTDGYVVITRFN